MDLSQVFTKEVLAKPGSTYRLTRITENVHFSNQERFVAAKLLLEKAISENNLELYERVRRLMDDKILVAFADKDRPAIPAQLDDPNWNKKLRLQYEGEVRTKNAELEQLAKNGLKDQIRVCLTDLAAIHIKYGMSGQAMTLWEKAYENSVGGDEPKNLCHTIIRHAFASQNIFFLDRFCKRGQQYFNQKQPEFTQFVTVMQFLCKLMENQPLQANQILYQSNISLIVDENADLNKIVTSQELAHYIVLAALADMPRMEIKNELLASSSVLSLLEFYSETADVFDNFMNGRFQALQKSLNEIKQKLVVDYFFNDNKVFNKIRANNLKQYVAPYKVLDMKDIASAFGINLQQCEDELASQISRGDIKARIDSHKKVLYSSVANKEFDTYKKINQSGEQFIRDVEMGLIKMACMKKGIVLQKPQSSLMQQLQ